MCYAGYTPHEGCKEASHPTAIVGLMRNNLSEVSTSLPVLYTQIKASLPAVCTLNEGFIASERLFLNNPTMDGTAKLAPAFVGTDRSDTTWSETMFLYCLM